MGLKIGETEKKQEERGKKYSVKRIADEQEYNKGIKEEGW